jgi:flagellar biosynthesis/type III secretory pathway chaperone
MRSRIGYIILLGIFILFLNDSNVSAQINNFIFDNANLIINEEPINKEIKFIQEEYGITVNIETSEEEYVPLCRIDANGQPTDIVIFFNKLTEKGEILYRKNTIINDKDIERILNSEDAAKYLEKKDYDNMFLQMILELKQIIQQKLLRCDKDKAERLYSNFFEIYKKYKDQNKIYEEEINIVKEFIRQCKNHRKKYEELINALINEAEYSYIKNDFENSFKLSFTAYNLSDNKIEKRDLALLFSIKAKSAQGGLSKGS